MRIVIVNTHSILNSGDAAIVCGQVGLLREVFDDPQIVVTSRTPDVDRDFYAHLGIGVLPPLFAAPSVFATRSAALVGCTRSLLLIAAKRALMNEIRAADLVISSGGGYFFSNRNNFPGPMFLQAFLQIRLAQCLGRPVLFAPQSFGPLRSRAARALLRSLLANPNVRHIFARETSSLNLVNELLVDSPLNGVISLCPDLAFALSPPRLSAPDHPSGTARVLGVTVREWDFPESASRADARARRAVYLDAVISTCIWFVQRYSGSVLVVPQARGPGWFEDDRPISRELVARLEPVLPKGKVSLFEVTENTTPEHILNAFTNVEVLLASRFHSAILAMVAGIPTVVLGYQPKSIGMMTMLELERFCLPMGKVGAESITNLLAEILSDRTDFIVRRIRPVVVRMKTQVTAALRPVLESVLIPENGNASSVHK